MENLDQLSEAEISRCLQPRPDALRPTQADGADSGFREAGVLVPFVRVAGSWHLLFIRRPASEKDPHSGQVAFAGGKREPSDPDLTATALREAHEEIGVHPQHVTVLGRLQPHHSRVSRFRIAPVVGTFQWPYELTLCPQEVARAFTIPLSWLANPDHHSIQQRQTKTANQSAPTIYFREYDGELLWGATARITLSLLNDLRVKKE